MKHLAILLASAAMALGCVTSEPIDLSRPDASVLPIMTSTGAAGQTNQAGASGGTAGAAGVNPSGAAGVMGGAGASGSAGTTGASGSSGGQGGSATMDAGATDTKTNMDARPSMDAASGEVSAYAATWTDIYNKMLNNPSYPSNCTGGGCHNPGTQKGLDFSTQAKGYTTVKAKLSVGNPNGSAIVSQLSGGKMPQARPKMPAADLNVIKAWIMAGALDN